MLPGTGPVVKGQLRSVGIISAAGYALEIVSMP